jgi:hypothetical protein
MMADENAAWDLGVITGIGIAVASGAALILVFSIFNQATPSNIAISMRMAACDIAYDIDDMASLSIPDTRKCQYSINGFDVFISPEFVIVEGRDNIMFTKPLISRPYPGRCNSNSGILWESPTGMKEYFNLTYGSNGEPHSPLDIKDLEKAMILLDNSSNEMINDPLHLEPGQTLHIEKVFIYATDNPGKKPWREGFVFVYV